MNKEEITRSTVMEINIENFNYNIEQIRKKLRTNTTIMPIMKANAYGTYLNTRLDVVNKFDIIGLATVDEGVELRKLGYEKEIFILNQPAIAEIDKIIENNLIIGISSKEFLKEAIRKQQEIKVHLEIETGMGRTGITIDEIEKFIKEIKESGNIKIEGIYSHMSSADTDDDYTKKQIEIFEEAVNKIKEIVEDIKYIHISASNGIINYPEAHYNLVRPGMIMYGYESGEGINEKIDLKPVAKLKSKITFLKNVEIDTSISYGRTFITKNKSKIATIPIGYADGMRRCLSNKGSVVINDKKVPIIGKICMDSFMVDVTSVKNVSVGDEVIIWDNDKITLDEIANQIDTINYEVISNISSRVPREFK